MATYKPLQPIVVSTTPTSVTFSGIDQNYTDLKLIVSGTSTSLVDSYCRVNGDTSSSYSYTRLYGTGSGSAASDRSSNQTEFKAGNFNTTPNSHELHFMNYSSTTAFKTMLFNTKESASAVIGHSCLWRNNAAINSITIYVTSGTFTAGSTFDLYGIKSGAPQALGGDVVVTDGNYWYHAFRSSGTFTAQRPMSADVLTIAGGGSGAENNAGGGAGGLLYSASQLLSPINYTVTIGAGAAGRAAASGLTGINGSNSVFGTLTAIGGGGGQNGTVGGSGGGASSVRTQGTSGQGNAGGLSGPATANYTGGGGGGAGQQGGDGQATVSGKGGDGVNTYSSWASATGTGANSGYYAGGGAGGWFSETNTGSSGGAGLGGGGNSGRPGSDGTANTGGGGAGGTRSVSGTNYASTNGGSGIVIVRYPV